MLGRTATAAEEHRLRVIDKVLLASWVWSYAVLLYGFGLIKRFEKANSKP